MRFRRPQLIPLLFIIGSTLLLGGLGVWQVERLQWKNALVADIDQAQSQPALEKLPAALGGLEYRNVSLEGTFLNDKEFRLAGGIQDEGPGYFYLTPFQLADGRIILVNRGFAPSGQEGAPRGTQTIHGILRQPRAKRFFSPENGPNNNLWFYEDLDAMSQKAGITLLPFVVEETGERKKNIYPIPNVAKISLRNDHLGYAFTWFSIALIGLIMFGFYHRIPEDRAKNMTDIRYISTRGTAPELAFDEVVLAGLATDGGLYVPNRIPVFSAEEIKSFKSLSYPELAFKIISPYTNGAIEPDALKKILDASYKEFRHKEIAPITTLDPHTYILELFHGPTLAFKDFALQFLGRLLDHILEKRHQKIVIVGATSGDTGSAAIAGCRGRSNMDIFILHPHGKVSEVQRRQMTTYGDANVHNIALEGTFDDCQNIVKALFNDQEFRRKHQLTAVNSINWARIVAQIPYYFYAALKLGAPDKKMIFTVPTGNFGDIYAGHIARRMGLPIEQLIIGTNSNNILTRCIATGSYSMGNVVHTLSPSMDIQVSSNFERLLFELYNSDGKILAALMRGLQEQKSITLSKSAHAQLENEFASASVNDKETETTIAETFKTTGYVLDPHTAVGLQAGRICRKDDGAPLIALATAHPAKFPDAVAKATGKNPALPEHLKDLFTRPERSDVLPNDVNHVKEFINAHCK